MMANAARWQTNEYYAKGEQDAVLSGEEGASQPRISAKILWSNRESQSKGSHRQADADCFPAEGLTCKLREMEKRRAIEKWREEG